MPILTRPTTFGNQMLNKASFTTLAALTTSYKQGCVVDTTVKSYGTYYYERPFLRPAGADCRIDMRLYWYHSTNPQYSYGIWLWDGTNSIWIGVVTPDGGATHVWCIVNGTTREAGSVGNTGTLWLSLRAVGDAWTGYYSSNGRASWTAVGAATTAANNVTSLRIGRYGLSASYTFYDTWSYLMTR